MTILPEPDLQTRCTECGVLLSYGSLDVYVKVGIFFTKYELVCVNCNTRLRLRSIPFSWTRKLDLSKMS